MTGLNAGDLVVVQHVSDDVELDRVAFMLDLVDLDGRSTLPQRLNYIASALTYFDGWQKLVFYLAPVWVLLSGTMPLLASAPEFPSTVTASPWR